MNKGSPSTAQWIAILSIGAGIFYMVYKVNLAYSKIDSARNEVRFLVRDRFYKHEFEAFLKANPELKPPAGWQHEFNFLKE